MTTSAQQDLVDPEGNQSPERPVRRELLSDPPTRALLGAARLRLDMLALGTYLPRSPLGPIRSQSRNNSMLLYPSYCTTCFITADTLPVVLAFPG